MEFLKAMLILAKYKFQVRKFEEGDSTMCSQIYKRKGCQYHTEYVVNGVPYCKNCLIDFGWRVRFVFEEEKND